MDPPGINRTIGTCPAFHLTHGAFAQGARRLLDCGYGEPGPQKGRVLWCLSERLAGGQISRLETILQRLLPLLG
jgi:hypothetical protein